VTLNDAICLVLLIKEIEIRNQGNRLSRSFYILQQTFSAAVSGKMNDRVIGA
jgi:hypothetical protein